MIHYYTSNLLINIYIFIFLLIYGKNLIEAYEYHGNRDNVIKSVEPLTHTTILNENFENRNHFELPIDLLDSTSLLEDDDYDNEDDADQEQDEDGHVDDKYMKFLNQKLKRNFDVKTASPLNPNIDTNTITNAYANKYKKPSMIIPYNTDNSLSDYELSDIVLVSDLKDGLYGLNRYTGEIIWSLNHVDIEHSILTITDDENDMIIKDSTGSKTNETLIIEPFGDGNIYFFNVFQGVTKLPISIHQLIMSSPMHLKTNFIIDEIGTVVEEEKTYTGSRQTSMFTIDIRTGTILSAFGFSTENKKYYDESDETNIIDPSNIIKIGKTTYRLEIHSNDSPSYDVTYTTWQRNSLDLHFATGNNFSKDGIYISPLKSTTSDDNSVMAIDLNNNEIKWISDKFSSGIITNIFDVFQNKITGDNVLAQHPVHQFNVNYNGNNSKELYEKVYLDQLDNKSWIALSEINFPSFVNSAKLSRYQQKEDKLGESYTYDLKLKFLKNKKLFKSTIIGVHYLNKEKKNHYYNYNLNEKHNLIMLPYDDKDYFTYGDEDSGFTKTEYVPVDENGKILDTLATSIFKTNMYSNSYYKNTDNNGLNSNNNKNSQNNNDNSNDAFNPEENYKLFSPEELQAYRLKLHEEIAREMNTNNKEFMLDNNSYISIIKNFAKRILETLTVFIVTTVLLILLHRYEIIRPSADLLKSIGVLKETEFYRRDSFYVKRFSQNIRRLSFFDKIGTENKRESAETLTINNKLKNSNSSASPGGKEPTTINFKNNDIFSVETQPMDRQISTFSVASNIDPIQEFGQDTSNNDIAYNDDSLTRIGNTTMDTSVDSDAFTLVTNEKKKKKKNKKNKKKANTNTNTTKTTSDANVTATTDSNSKSNATTVATSLLKKGNQDYNLSSMPLIRSNSQNPIPIDDDHDKNLKNLTVSKEVLGFGSLGTVVYKGKFEGRPVAIKRMLIDFCDIASTEIDLLSESDDHPNVIRYYCSEETGRFLYIALELCNSNLEDLVEKRRLVVKKMLLETADVWSRDWESLTILNQIASGVNHLHLLKIIHRDIKPQNILVATAKKFIAGQISADKYDNSNIRILISDFGLCKKLESDKSSFQTNVNNAAGTTGWRAPELLDVSKRALLQTIKEVSENDKSASQLSNSDAVHDDGSKMRLTRAIDIFSMGCVFYYILSNGEHPFGDRYIREANIIKGSFNLSKISATLTDESLQLEAKDLISRMISNDPLSRPPALDVLKHPLFWSVSKKLQFLLKVSDRFEGERRDPPSALLLELEANAKFVILNGNWTTTLDSEFISSLGKYRKYSGASFLDLLRAFRNKYHHYQDTPASISKKIGILPDGFYFYFIEKFPNLLLELYKLIEENLNDDPSFIEYL
ncbi:hypothetical protein TPHA_0H01470 [Tetrapisispora phaffii CBS 4417]|uniref:non-specific serine/threonine protein kinase n=1 Tax=Tetrapisispora phaffii (strain ATCC 24235 / CBS 4417 / NBRC 1672 / NRRL Y-8282 / UCD 70-5) TaxID=1071381 RepID=G8BX49_TETPH|nr:hypothetical protein TPHA_0H01470 [Tetrapisispora phaffii CBS 4417]CCE64353.1 hypothetical protein TPHA_0H01470 [Tetrapisispora phaffii CBS 4417]